MSSNTKSTPQAEPSTELTGGQRLVLRRKHDEDLIELLNPDGHVTLSIHVTKRGPILRFDIPSLTIQASEELSLEANHLSIHGHEGLSLTTGGDLDIEASGDMKSRARIQNIEAALGNVNIEANDHVRLNGVLIKLNC